MSILIGSDTRVIVQGITGGQGRYDAGWMLKYGTRIVAGVTPGKRGEDVLGVPVFDSMKAALDAHPADASVLYVPPRFARQAAAEALEAGIRLIVGTTEYVPVHDALYVFAMARERGARIIGFNTNGVISPGQCKLGGVGGMDPGEIFHPGRIGVCSRSGGMTAEIGLTLKSAGLGISTSIGMGGDAHTGLSMAEIVRLFEEDPGTDAVIIFGEPGTRNEHQVADLIESGAISKPVVVLLAGQFQERYARGQSFGHTAAMISSEEDSVTSKKKRLRAAGAIVADALDEVPQLLKPKLRAGSSSSRV